MWEGGSNSDGLQQGRLILHDELQEIGTLHTVRVFSSFIYVHECRYIY
jgi:hypothetical protein